MKLPSNELFEKEIQMIKDDLGITKENISITFREPDPTAYGSCQYYPSGSYIKIEINNNLTFDMGLYSLAHELRHAWQFFTGLLKTGSSEKYIVWNDIEYALMTAKDSLTFEGGAAAYLNQPWEVDANQYADNVYDMILLKHEKITDHIISSYLHCKPQTDELIHSFSEKRSFFKRYTITYDIPYESEDLQWRYTQLPVVHLEPTDQNELQDIISRYPVFKQGS